MRFLSRLLGRSANAPAEPQTVAPSQPFQLPWCCEGSTEGLELDRPRVLLSDIEGITASNIATIRDACRRAGSPLVVVTPGVDRSFLQLLSEGDLVAIKAADVPGQPVAALFEDLAAITGGNVMFKELGFGLALPESLSKMAEHGIHVPDFSWESLTLDSLARLTRIVVSREGVEFYCAKTLWKQRDVQARMAVILREPATAGHDERLRRLCTATGCLPDKAKTLAVLHTDFSAEYALGLASPYFVTDPNTMECRLDDAYVAVFGEPLNDLELLIRLLGQIAAAGRPLLILAPSVSDEALAICVVNKLRGIIQCAVAVSRTPSKDPGAMLTQIAGRTGTQVITQAEARRVQGPAFLGRAATVRGTRDGMALTPTADEHASDRSGSRPARPAIQHTTTTVRIENRIVAIEISEGALYVSGEFAGNLDFALSFSESVPTETVLQNLRVRIPGKKKLLRVAGYEAQAGGLAVTVYSELAPPGRDLSAGLAPSVVEVFWLGNSTREPVAQMAVVVAGE